MDYLNSENYTKIHVLNRAQIIDDAFYFLLQRQFDYDDFWHLTSFLLRDINFVTWYPMFKVFESLSCMVPFHYNDDAKEKIRSMIDQLLTTIGYNYTEIYAFDLNISLREEAVKWACTLGVPACRSKAASELNNELENFVKNNNTIGKKWIFCYGSIAANNTIWFKMLSKFNEINDDRFLEYLTCFENVAIISNYLKQIILGDIQLPRNTRASVFLSIVEKHAKKNAVLSIILKNLRNVTLTSNWKNDEFATLIVIITHVYSTNHMDMITNYIMQYSPMPARRAIEMKLNKRRSEYRKLYGNYGRFGY
nr:PREDICTED: aminopeptidase N-like isoform X2 [Linepithema humile]XP_012235300.1 PREDICTED: aminopeptidase N-like isoform X2 [Linepithema humile]